MAAVNFIHPAGSGKKMALPALLGNEKALSNLLDCTSNDGLCRQWRDLSEPNYESLRDHASPRNLLSIERCRAAR
jgi:hypothetical protein